ncbi:MAG: hypothetical protein ACI97K_002775 [Glaciecola sp.]|jgi:hypothetical protein
MTKHLKNIVPNIAKCCVVLITITIFTTVAKAAEFSLGHGIQYSGLAGIQVASKGDNHNFRASVGIIGLGIGYDYFLNDQFSIGGSTFVGFEDGTALNFNYYPSGYDQGRWMLGLDIGRVKEGIGFPSMAVGCIIDCQQEKEKTSTIAWFSVGYKF